MGGRKLNAALDATGHKKIPSAKTYGNILKRYSFISPEKSQKHRAFQRFEREKCNDLWQMDFKGDFLLGDGSRCSHWIFWITIYEYLTYILTEISKYMDSTVWTSRMTSSPGR